MASKKHIDELKKRIISDGFTDSIIIGYTEDGESITLMKGDNENLARAMFSAIAKKGGGNIGKNLYCIITDVLLNLFEIDDTYREEFVRDMMIGNAIFSNEQEEN